MVWDTYLEHVYFQFLCLGQCQRPSSGCSNSIDIYKIVDCDGDGILDHACSTTVNSHRWLVLSSEGCPSSWGPASRPVSKCPQAFGGTIDKIQQEFDAPCSCTWDKNIHTF